MVTIPRAPIAETIDLVAVLSGRGSARHLSELARVEGLGPLPAWRASGPLVSAVSTRPGRRLRLCQARTVGVLLETVDRHGEMGASLEEPELVHLGKKEGKVGLDLGKGSRPRLLVRIPGIAHDILYAAIAFTAKLTSRHIGADSSMPMGSEHFETGLLLRDGAGLVLHRDDGGQWRLDGGLRPKSLLGRRVRIHGVRCGFDRCGFDILAVRKIGLAD